MSIITDKIGVAKSVTVDKTDTPLDARTRCDSVADFPNIEHPFVGMQIYTISDGKFWVVKSLKSKLIGAITVADAVINTYEELKGGSGGGDYTAGYGLTLTDTEFSVDTTIMATVTLVENSVQDLRNEIPNTANFVTTTQLNNTIGDIDSVLDTVNEQLIAINNEV